VPELEASVAFAAPDAPLFPPGPLVATPVAVLVDVAAPLLPPVEPEVAVEAPVFPDAAEPVA
jgi:hypothetical protein